MSTPAARKRSKRWALAAVLLLVVIVAGVAAATLLKPAASTTSNVSTGRVTRQTLKVVVSGSGSAVVSNAVTVNPKISGTVKKLYASLGKKVDAGDTLYTLTSDTIDTQVLQAKASLLQAKQSLNQAEASKQQAANQLYQARTQKIQAQQELDNLQGQPSSTAGLANKIVIAKRALVSAKKNVAAAEDSLDNADVGIEVAEANYTSAQENYNDVKDGSSDTVITAPIDGVVTVQPLSVGSDVTAGTTNSSSSGSSGSSGSAMGTTSSSTSNSSGSGSSITISDMSSLEVEVSVSEADITSVAIGQIASITFDAIANKTYAGTVRSISPNGTTSSGVVNYTVTLKLKAQDSKLKPDMTATADIATRVATDVLTVPSAAVKSANGSTYVTVVDAGGAMAQAPVTVGVSDDSHVEVKSGLTEGQTVVTGSASTSSSTGAGNSSKAAGGFMMGGGVPGSGPGGR